MIRVKLTLSARITREEDNALYGDVGMESHFLVSDQAVQHYKGPTSDLVTIEMDPRVRKMIPRLGTGVADSVELAMKAGQGRRR